jgi:cytochrome c-type biogenesis protein CcmH
MKDVRIYLRVAITLTLLLGGAAFTSASSLAVSPNPPPTAEPSSGGTTGPSAEEVDRVSEGLYCPLCTGVRLDNCDLPLCDQMREVIRQKLAAGETGDEIKAYFVNQYGDVVLGAPPKRGGMIITWVLPLLTVLVAGGWIAFLARRWARRCPPDAQEIENPDSLPREYLERVEQELEEWE